MKCKNCGAELIIDKGKYVCNHCGSNFLFEEFFPMTFKNNEFSIVGGVLLKYLGNESKVEIPYGIVSIGKEAFKNNISLRKVIFSKTVIQIDKSAFEGCYNLMEIINYDNIIKFDDFCFRFAGLEQIVIGKNVDYLGNCCFSRMPNLKKVFYNPSKIIKLKHTFEYSSNLIDIKENKLNFFPSYHTSLELINNPNNKRPTWGDAFIGTLYIKKIKEKYLKYYKKGICPECGGKIKKSFFHARCKNCGIDYKN